MSEGVIHLSRTHPLVEGLAAHVLDMALDVQQDGVAHRAGTIRTDAVAKRTTLLLCRFRFDITTTRGGVEQTQLAEEIGLLAFEGAPDPNARWLDAPTSEALLDASPSGNIGDDQKRSFISAVIASFDSLRPQLDTDASRRADALLDAHRRVRVASRTRGLSYRVTEQLPVDLLGIYVLLPAAS